MEVKKKGILSFEEQRHHNLRHQHNVVHNAVQTNKDAKIYAVVD